MSYRSLSPERIDHAVVPTGPTPWSVCIWSWRRFASRGRFRALPALALALSFAIAWIDSFNINLDVVSESAHLNTYYAFFIVSVNLSLLGLAAVAMAASLVAEDLEAGVQDLLMATSMSGRAYIWGRFLAGSSALAAISVIMVLGSAAAHLVLHLGAPLVYDEPSWPAYALAWLFNAPMHAVAVTGVAFAIGTRYPRLARVVAIGGALLWWSISVGALSSIVAPQGYPWLPVPREIANALYLYYEHRYRLALSSAMAPVDTLALAREIGRGLPDLSVWWSQLLYPLAALGLVEWTARTFDRFRGEEGSWS